MLSVIIATDESEAVLVATLSALVPGATAGIVREVIIADAGSHDETGKIADVAGCSFIVQGGPLGARLASAAAMARGAWLLFLRPGIVLEPAWINEARRFVQQVELGGESSAAVFRPPPPPGGERRLRLLQVLALLAGALWARPQPDQGLLVAKRRYEKVGGHSATAAEPEADLLRRLGSPITTLDCGTMLVRG
jgi:glycosyltransferase involved in cell wall biosynthesis